MLKRHEEGKYADGGQNQCPQNEAFAGVCVYLIPIVVGLKCFLDSYTVPPVHLDLALDERNSEHDEKSCAGKIREPQKKVGVAHIVVSLFEVEFNGSDAAVRRDDWPDNILPNPS